MRERTTKNIPAGQLLAAAALLQSWAVFAWLPYLLIAGIAAGLFTGLATQFLLERLERARVAGQVDFFFVEAALLIEGGYLALVDEMWYIYADEAVRRQRLKASRGYSEEKIARIMSSQLGEAQFRESCGFVIDNSGELAESCRQIDRRLSGLKCRE